MATGTTYWTSGLVAARLVEGHNAPIMMTVFDWTPVRPGIGAAARATMNGYAANTLLVKKYLH